MIVKDIKLYHYNLPLKKSLKLNEFEINERVGCLLKITDDNNNYGWGEIAPLNGFSRETIDDCQNEIKTVYSLLYNKPVPNNIVELTSSLPPSVRFGLETALLSLVAMSKGINLILLFNPLADIKVKVNGLLSGSENEILQKAEKLFNDGFRAFKVKIGRTDFENEIRTISKLRNKYDKNIILRLDANRAFTLDEGIKFMQAVREYDIEYIEEPFEKTELLFDYISKNEQIIPVALDETLYLESKSELLASDNLKKVKAFILKPTLLGYTTTMQFARLALENHILPVISSAYESAYGIYILAMMAAIIDSSIPCGLDTLDLFENNISEMDIKITDGIIDLNRYPNYFESINLAMLNPIEI